MTGGSVALKVLGSGLILVASGCQALRPANPTAVPTPTEVEPDIDYLPGRGVQIAGHGDAVTIPITPQYTQGITAGISIVTASHDGQSAFTVQAISDNQPSVLVAGTGQYRGARPLVVQNDVRFQVKAEGNWTLRVEPFRNGGQPAFFMHRRQRESVLRCSATRPVVHLGRRQKAVRPNSLREG